MLMAVLSFAMTAYSLDVTINDGVGSGTGWYSANRENQEVEPNTTSGQVWDMERFVLNGNNLTMTGGFNFTSPGGYGGFRPGDLFIDTDSFGYYDYVAVIGYATSTYDVYAIEDDVDIYSVHFPQNAFSDPWRYKSGGTLISSGELALYGSYASAEGTHYTLDIDLSWLNPYLNNGDIVTLHNTMECGNDNLMGQYVADIHLPESGNMLAMIGIGFAALLLSRKRL